MSFGSMSFGLPRSAVTEVVLTIEPPARMPGLVRSVRSRIALAVQSGSDSRTPKGGCKVCKGGGIGRPRACLENHAAASGMLAHAWRFYDASGE